MPALPVTAPPLPNGRTQRVRKRITVTAAAKEIESKRDYELNQFKIWGEKKCSLKYTM